MKHFLIFIFTRYVGLKLNKDADSVFLATALTKIMQARIDSELCIDLQEWYGLGFGLRDKAWMMCMRAPKKVIKEHSINIVTHDFETLIVRLLTGHRGLDD